MVLEQHLQLVGLSIHVDGRIHWESHMCCCHLGSTMKKWSHHPGTCLPFGLSKIGVLFKALWGGLSITCNRMSAKRLTLVNVPKRTIDIALPLTSYWGPQFLSTLWWCHHSVSMISMILHPFKCQSLWFFHRKKPGSSLLPLLSFSKSRRKNQGTNYVQ